MSTAEKIINITEIADIVVEAKEKYDECRNENKSIGTCILDTAYEVSENVTGESLKLVNKEIFGKVTKIADAVNYAEQCIDDGHSKTSCLIGAASDLGTTIGVSGLAEAAVVSSIAIVASGPVTVIGAATAITAGSAGLYTLIKSSEIGRSMADVTVGVVEYLADHVPGEMIDSSKAVIIKNEDTVIEFSPPEVKFIKGIIQTYQAVNSKSIHIADTMTMINKGMKLYAESNKNMTMHFDEHSHQLTMNLDAMNSGNLVDSLNNIKTEHKLNALPQTATSELINRLPDFFPQQTQPISSPVIDHNALFPPMVTYKNTVNNDIIPPLVPYDHNNINTIPTISTKDLTQPLPTYVHVSGSSSNGWSVVLNIIPIACQFCTIL